MKRILATFLLLVSCCKAQPSSSCSVPTVCTRDDGTTFTTWRPLNDQPPITPTPPPFVQTATTTTSTVGISGGNSETVQQLNRRIELLTEPGWLYGGNNYQYWISNPGVNVPRSHAISVCDDLNAHIARVGLRDNATRQFIVDNVLRRCGNIHGWWIGLTDDAQEGVHIWDDGVPAALGHTDWEPGQPDNYNDGDCVVIAQYFDYKWDDVPCETANNGILCERYVGP